MSQSAWTSPPCRICGRKISAAGFARVSHLRSHVRAGLLIERTKTVRPLDGWRTYTRIEFRLTELGVASVTWAPHGEDRRVWLTSFQL